MDRDDTDAEADLGDDLCPKGAAGAHLDRLGIAYHGGIDARLPQGAVKALCEAAKYNPEVSSFGPDGVATVLERDDTCAGKDLGDDLCMKEPEAHLKGLAAIYHGTSEGADFGGGFSWEQLQGAGHVSFNGAYYEPGIGSFSPDGNFWTASQALGARMRQGAIQGWTGEQ